MRPRSQCAGCPRTALVAFAALAVIAPTAGVAGTPAAAQEVRYTRPIDVPAVGWMRVPLDPEILREAAPFGGSLRLFGPEGEEVPFRRVLSGEGGERIPAQEVSATRTAAGWLVVLELTEAGTEASAPVPLRHDRVRLELDAALPADTGVRVEGSDDGSSWELLAVARPDPSGVASDGAAIVELAYAATDARFLRLLWSPTVSTGGAGTEVGGETAASGLRSASVETVPARSLGIAVPRPECRSIESPAVGPRSVCPLPVVSAGGHLRRLDLTVTARGPVGYRLLAPEDGRWEPVAAGVWTSPLAETPHSLGLDLDLPRPAEPLRLELYGDGADLALARADAELGGEALVFQARRAGRHTLAYGSGVYQSSRSTDVRLPSGVEPRRIEPGPEEAGGMPSGGTPLPASAGPAPSVRFARRWPVHAEAPAAGDLFRLPLTGDVYAVARPDLGDLRLLANDLQVPYVRWRPAEPASVATVRGATPSPVGAGTQTAAGARNVLRVGVDLETPELPLSALVVHAAAARFRHRVRVLAVEPATPGGEPSVRSLSPWLEWACTPRPPLSCRLSIALADDRDALRDAGAGAGRSARLVLEIDRGHRRDEARGAGGDGAADAPAAPGGLDLELWRRQDQLLFAWPDGGSGGRAGAEAAVRLAAGAEGLEAPDYDLAARRDELLARPSRRADLAVDGNGTERGGWAAGWTVGLVLLVAFGFLLFLLDRILSAREPSG